MSRIVLLKIFFLSLIFSSVISHSMGQITLTNLLDFQNRYDPAFIHETLSDGWLSNYLPSVSEKQDTFYWHKKTSTQSFGEGDELNYIYIEGFKPAIIYMTVSSENFESILQEVQSSMSATTQADLKDENNKITGKEYIFSNELNVIEVFDSYVKNKYNITPKVFLVYSKIDYQNGLKLR